MSTFSTLPSVFEVLAGIGFALLIIWALSWWESRSLMESRSRTSTRMRPAPPRAVDFEKAHANWKRQREGFLSSIPAKDTPSNIQTLPHTEAASSPPRVE